MMQTNQQLEEALIREEKLKAAIRDWAIVSQREALAPVGSPLALAQIASTAAECITDQIVLRNTPRLSNPNRRPYSWKGSPSLRKHGERGQRN